MRKIDRLDKYMSTKKLNDNQVTVNCGLSVGLLGKARRGDCDLGEKSIEKILNFYQDINRVWLLTGEGDMLISSAKKIGDVAKASSDEFVLVDYIPVRASASFIESLCDEKMCVCDKIPVIPQNGEILKSDEYKIFEVSGDSMAPTINDGALILVKEIPESKWAYAEGVAVVVFQDMVVVKRISRNEILTKNCLFLSSDNPKYGQMQVALADIRAIYKAKRKISENIF